MNGIEIDKILMRNAITRPFYRGCFASDQIPLAAPAGVSHPWCLVANLDPGYLAGSHWVALYSDRAGTIEYYDSFGQWPPPSAEICQFLDRFDRIQYNRMQIQSTRSKSCGKHAIFFLHQRCSGQPFCGIIKQLANGSVKADDRIRRFISKTIFNEE